MPLPEILANNASPSVARSSRRLALLRDTELTGEVVVIRRYSWRGQLFLVPSSRRVLRTSKSFLDSSSLSCVVLFDASIATGVRSLHGRCSTKRIQPNWQLRFARQRRRCSSRARANFSSSSRCGNCSNFSRTASICSRVWFTDGV